MFRVCIISCGEVAKSAHIPAYRHFSEDFDVVGVCDINEKVAKEAAKRYGIANYYTDAQSMLQEQRPDVVSVCVPNRFHKEYTILALENGANVICEKPVALNYLDAKEMFECARKNGRILMACQNMRFTPERMASKRYITENKIDDIYYAEISRTRRRGIPFWGDFHKKEISGGGAVADIGAHILDSLIWLMGNPEIKSVSAVLFKNHYKEAELMKSSRDFANNNCMKSFNSNEMNVEDFSGGMIKFKNGAICTFKIAWATNMPERTEMRLIGKEKGIFLPECKVYFGENGEEFIKTEAATHDTPFYGHICVIDNLRKVLKGEEEPIIKPEETLNVSKIIEMVYKSAELEREVFADEL